MMCVIAAGAATAEEKEVTPRTLSPETMSRLMKEMILVEGGTFTMGSNSDKASSAEGPAHKVTLDGFRIGKFEVSQQLFQEVMVEKK